jgi:hypothetical protein
LIRRGERDLIARDQILRRSSVGRWENLGKEFRAAMLSVVLVMEEKSLFGVDGGVVKVEVRSPDFDILPNW